MNGEWVFFFLVAAVAVGSSLAVVLHPNPVYCALALVVALAQVALLFLQLGAPAIAFLQILVYAGAILVLFLFVIMLLNVQRDRERASPRWRRLAAGLAAAMGLELGGFFLLRPLAETPGGRAPAAGFGSLSALADALFTGHVLAFELTSLLLLVAIVGAVVIARRG
jgi:NADH-quinone oxidoreductase subunit J